MGALDHRDVWPVGLGDLGPSMGEILRTFAQTKGAQSVPYFSSRGMWRTEWIVKKVRDAETRQIALGVIKRPSGESHSLFFVCLPELLYSGDSRTYHPKNLDEVVLDLPVEGADREQVEDLLSRAWEIVLALEPSVLSPCYKGAR